MKSSLKWLGAGVWLAGVGSLAAQEASSEFDPLGEHVEMPRLVRVQVEFIEMSHPTLTRLMAKPREGADDSGLRRELAGLIEKGEASVLETMTCIARSGEKATSESIEEFIYPTEYDPAELPSHVNLGKDGGQLATGPTPTAFELRNLGSTLEIMPTLGSGGKLIDLTLVPEIVYHVGNDTWAEWKDARGDASVRMPKMYSLRLRANLTLLAGQPLMAAALSPKGEDGFPDFGRKVMVFVRGDVVGVGR